MPCRPSRAGSLDKCRCRRLLRRAAAAAPENHHKRPEDSRGACHRLLNVLEGVIASRQHPRRASEPVSRVVDPPSSSRRRHHPPVESKTSLPLPKNPTVSSQASRRPGAGILAFFSHARSLAHVTWASATLRGSLVLHPVTPQHRPPVRNWLSPLSPCRWRWQLQLSQSAEWFHRARPAVPSRGRFSAGAAPGSMRTRAGGVLCCCPLHWCCSCCLVLPACVLLRAACCVLCLKTLNDLSTRLLFFPLPTPPRVLTRQPLFFLHTRPLCCQAATPS